METFKYGKQHNKQRYVIEIFPQNFTSKRSIRKKMEYTLDNKIPKCHICQKGLYTFDHIFEYCDKFKILKLRLINDIRNININLPINSTLIQTGTNNKEENRENGNICNTVMIYLLDVLESLAGHILANKCGNVTPNP